jgi:hypothetical protein
MAARSDPI